MNNQLIILLSKALSMSTRTRKETEAAVAKGYGVTVLSWDRYREAQKKLESREGFKVRNFVLADGRSFSKLNYVLSYIVLQFLFVFWCLRNVKGKYILHCNDLNTLFAGVALKGLMQDNVKLTYDCREYTPSEYSQWYGFTVGIFAGAVERALLKYVDTIFTVCSPLQGYLSRVSSAPVVLLYNTPSKSDVPKEAKNQLRDRFQLKGFVVSFVGMLRQDVESIELIGAARMLKEKSIDGIQFLIVGYGPDYDRVEAAAADLGSDYVRFVSRVSPDEALRYVKASDLTFAVYRTIDQIESSRSTMLTAENSRIAMPWKVFESMACGTPILVSENSLTWSFVEKLGYGLSAGYGTAPEIASRLEWALNHNDDLTKMSDSAKRHFYAEYNWDAMSKHFVSDLDRLLNVSHADKNGAVVTQLDDESRLS